MQIIWWVEWDAFKTPSEIFRDCALAKTADNQSIDGSMAAQLWQAGRNAGSSLIDRKCQMIRLCTQGI